MNPARASLVIVGEVVVAARPDGCSVAEAIGIAGGRVVSAGSRSDVTDAAAAGARLIDTGGRAVIPGLHDFHLHLVGLARARREVRLDDAHSPGEMIERVAAAARRSPPDAWLLGRGWDEALLPPSALDALEAAVGEHPTWLGSHDGHSVWASRTALRRGGISRDTADPPAGRIERDAAGEPTGVLREEATAAVNRVAERLSGPALAEALGETLADLAARGLTGATDAGDYDTSNGFGAWAAFGDSFSNLAEAKLDGRLRLTIDIPAAGIAAAAARGLRSGAAVDETRRVGWAKLYADGALGSRTAALFEPYSCGATGDTGILRVTPDELDRLLTAARPAGIAMAIHAIGDRAVASVLDAYARAPARVDGAPPDRLEHAQLVRPFDRPRFAALDVTASLQPLHCPSDRESVESCWAGRVELAYAWRSLADAGARLAFGSDAPVEPVDPWLGMFAAVHRRYPHESVDWRPGEALGAAAALSAYTLGPAIAAGRRDEGHLQPGALADLAVLDVDLATLLTADERLADVRAQLTMVGGRETHRS